MDNLFDLEFNEFRNNNHNLDLTGLSDFLQPSDTEEFRALSSKVQCLEQQLNQLMQTVSYCFDTMNQFQAMNTKFETFEKLLHTTVSDVAALKRQSYWKLGNQAGATALEESPGTTVTVAGSAQINVHGGLDQVTEGACPGPDQVYNTQVGTNAIDTQAIESINVGDTSKIPDEPEAAAVPKSNDDTENKRLCLNDGLGSHDPKGCEGDVMDYVGVGNFDYAVYEMTGNNEDVLDHPLNSLGGQETKEIYIDDFELDLEPPDQNHLYSTVALDELVKFGLRPRKNGEVANNDAKVSFASTKQGKESSQVNSDDEDGLDTVDPCIICGKVLSRRKDMWRHMSTHDQKNGFPCPDCGKYFARKDSIKKHQKQNQCSKLDQVRYQTELLQGRATVAAENSTPDPSNCAVCGEAFDSRLKMKEHVRNVHDKDKKMFRCKECGKTFHRKVNLKAHLLKHEKDTPCRCETCGRVFARYFDLSRHEKSHSGIKEHKCDICGAVFTRGSGLTNHQRIHQSESAEDRNHICSKCGAAFKDLRALSKHNKKQHSEAADKNGSSNGGVNGIGDSNGFGENQGRQQLSELNQLKNIVTNGEESSYQLFDSIGLPPLDEEFEDMSFR